MAAARLGVSKYLVVPLSLALLALAMSAPLVAAKNGGNSDNAKLCQKGGWMGLATSDGTAFASEDDCVSYGAQGGSYDVLLSINGTAQPYSAVVGFDTSALLSGLIPVSPYEYRCGFDAENALPCQGLAPLGTQVTLVFLSLGPAYSGPRPIVTCPDGSQPAAGVTYANENWYVECPTYTMDGPAQVSWTFATT